MIIHFYNTWQQTLCKINQFLIFTVLLLFLFVIYELGSCSGCTLSTNTLGPGNMKSSKGRKSAGGSAQDAVKDYMDMISPPEQWDKWNNNSEISNIKRTDNFILFELFCTFLHLVINTEWLNL